MLERSDLNYCTVELNSFRQPASSLIQLLNFCSCSLLAGWLAYNDAETSFAQILIMLMMMTPAQQLKLLPFKSGIKTMADVQSVLINSEQEKERLALRLRQTVWRASCFQYY